MSRLILVKDYVNLHLLHDLLKERENNTNRLQRLVFFSGIRKLSVGHILPTEDFSCVGNEGNKNDNSSYTTTSNMTKFILGLDHT